MTDNSDEITVNLQRAETSIRAAKDMIEKGYYDIVASRAYYAAFYTASALLLKQSSKSDCQFAPTRSLIPLPPRHRDFHAPAPPRFAVSARNAGEDRESRWLSSPAKNTRDYLTTGP